MGLCFKLSLGLCRDRVMPFLGTMSVAFVWKEGACLRETECVTEGMGEGRG